MKKNISVQVDNYVVELITNGKDEFDNVVICFHGFNGDKWGDAYSGLKKRAENSLVCSFDSCGHGESQVKAEEMRFDLVLKEIDAVVNFIKKEVKNKPIILVGGSYGAYRVMCYLIEYNPKIDKVIFVNPAFRLLERLEELKGFKYSSLKEGDKVLMKESLNKYMSKAFLDDIYSRNLYSKKFDLDYDCEIVVGTNDTLIPFADSQEISERYGYKISKVHDKHCFENKDNWLAIAKIIDGVKKEESIKES